jgi:uncharacterized protein YegP (UPF0339 family)
MTEFSRRADVEIIKDEPLTPDEWAARYHVTDPTNNAAYRYYLEKFQAYRWHAQAGNEEIISDGESYFDEAGAINAVELNFGDDTTMYWARTYGDDRSNHLLRYGKTDREHQAGAPNLLDGTAEFMRLAKQPAGEWIHDAPSPVTANQFLEVRELRRALLREEFSEYLGGEANSDLVEIVDGLLDVIVIAWGTLITYIGEDRAKAAAAEVVRSNLDKVIGDGLPIFRGDGKVLKPEGWTAPDIAGAIA